MEKLRGTEKNWQKLTPVINTTPQHACVCVRGAGPVPSPWGRTPRARPAGSC